MIARVPIHDFANVEAAELRLLASLAMLGRWCLRVLNCLFNTAWADGRDRSTYSYS